MVTHGETGFLPDTRVAPLRPHVATTTFGETDRTHLVHAGAHRLVRLASFVDAATALADEDRRAAMGAAARRREQSRDHEAVARELRADLGLLAVRAPLCFLWSARSGCPS